MSILVLLLLGSSAGDLAELLDVHDYCQVRKIAITPAQMLELANTTPKDARQELQQLLALRYFDEHAADVQKAANFQAILTTIEAIAAGKQAQDPLGFAQEYAARAAIALGSKTVKASAAPVVKDSVRKEALAWFPKEVTMVAAVDCQQVGSSANRKVLREMLIKQMPPEIRAKVYTEIEKVGNVRIERLAYAYAHGAGDMPNGRHYLRLTGKASQQRLIELLNSTQRNQFTVTTAKSPEGTVIAQVHKRNEPPAFAFLGNTDVLIAFYERERENQHMQLIDSMLAVRAAKSPSVLAGPLAARLELTAAQAIGLFVGDFPPEMRREFERGQPGLAAPKSGIVELTRKGEQVRLEARLTVSKAEEAKQLAALVLAGRDKAKAEVAGAENKPLPVPLPKTFFKDVQQMLDSVQAEAKGDILQASLNLDPHIFIYGVLLTGLRNHAPDDPAPPQPKQQEAQPRPRGTSFLDRTPLPALPLLTSRSRV